MKFFEIEIGSNNAKLSAYLHDVSCELSNAEKRPAVLVLPGGGYTMCSDREAEPIALAYMAEGYNAFVLRYSVGHGIPDIASKALMDTECAMEKICENADEWGIIKEKIAVVGFSAGGHLAASLGTIGVNKPSAMILGYPCILKSMMESLRIEASGLDNKVDDKTPPAFIFHTANDPVVPVKNSLLFADALAEKNIAFELHIFQNGPHGLSLAKALTSDGQAKHVNPSVAQWFSMSVNWLKALWGDFLVGAEYEDELSKREFSITKTVIRLLKNNAEVWRLVVEELPMLEMMANSHDVINNLTIEKLAKFSPDAISAEAINKLQERFSDINKD